ncbi:MAG: hypothetical protein KAJ60_02675, partial [Desulfobulbaceae bacterium]|nr:hypothetical protein [Desulfobulbaceae bacterium]
NVTVTAVNDAPSLTNLDTPAAFLENTINATPAIIDADVTFADIDLLDLDGGTLTVSGLDVDDVVSVNSMGVGLNNVRLNVDVVEFDSTGAGGWTQFGAVAGGGGVDLVITFDTDSTPALVDTLIENINYMNTSDVPPASHDLSFTVLDGDGGSTGAQTATITITAENDAPSFSGLNANPTFVEDGAAIVLDADAIIVDPELDAADDYGGATLTIVRNGGNNADDVFANTGNLTTLTESGTFNLGGGNIGTVTTNSNGTLVLTFAAGATSVNVDEVLQSITYSNSNNNPLATVLLDYTINDQNVAPAQGAGLALSGPGSITVNLIPTNDAPSASNLTTTSFYNEDDPSVAITDIVVTDPDNAEEITAILTLTNTATGALSANDGAFYDS